MSFAISLPSPYSCVELLSSPYPLPSPTEVPSHSSSASFPFRTGLKDSFSLGASDQQGHTTIRREARNFYRFIKGGDSGLNAIRRETMFINILQGLHTLEAEILTLAKDKNLSDKYKITRENVSEAYPDIIWRDGGK